VEQAVSWLNTHTVAPNNTSQCVTREDFRKLFTKDTNGLHLLSFLLTADHEKAERCFLAGLDECVDGDSVFQEWAHSWTRRMIVRNAVQMIARHPGAARSTPCKFCSAGKSDLPEIALEGDPFTRVLALQDFERFVYVLSVLEGYSIQDCAGLLGTSQQTVEGARICALKHIGQSEQKIAESTNDSSCIGVG
jgi:hypothetical protein